MENKKRSQGIPQSKFFIILLFIIYANYKYIYGAEAIALLNPFTQLLIEIGLYTLGIFVGKPFIKDLKEYVSQQIGILTNKKFDDERKVHEQEALLKYMLLDINDFYERDGEAFRKHLVEQGYSTFTINVHPNGKPEPEVKPEPPKVETPPA